MRKQRAYSTYAREAVLLLGRQIRLLRKEKKWSEKNLADRADISRATLRKIENGEMSCAIGLVFEVASIVGVHFFEQDKAALTRSVSRVNDTIALLPRRTRRRDKPVDDDF